MHTLYIAWQPSRFIPRRLEVHNRTDDQLIDTLQTARERSRNMLRSVRVRDQRGGVIAVRRTCALRPSLATHDSPGGYGPCRCAPCHRASGSGRSWNFTTFGRFSLPPSRWNIVLVE